MRLKSRAMSTGICLLALAWLVAGCGSGTESKATSPATDLATPASTKARITTPSVPAETEAAVVTAINGFGVALLHEETDGTQNAVIAPFSASLSMALLRAGAVGATQTSISTLMHLSGTIPDVDAAYNSLDLAIKSRLDQSTDGSSFQSGVSGWTQNSYSYNRSYLDRLAENYGLHTTNVDFALNWSAAADAVNQWSLQTTGMQGGFYAGNATRLVLGGGFQLLSPWKDPFDPSLTASGPFHRLDGSEVQVNFLHKSATIKYASGDGYVALGLPLAGGQEFVAIVPDGGRFGEINSSLSAARWQQLVSSLSPVQVNLALPLFSFKTTLGIDPGIAASEGVADFSAISPSRELFVSYANHSAKVSVNASGVQAGSVTLLALEDADPQNDQGGNDTGFILTGTMPSPEVTISLGRPFLFAVRDITSGAFLILGQVVDPTK